MLAAILPLLLGAVSVFSGEEVCKSGQRTVSGECCKQCQPGEGMVQPCGVKQTVCEPCLDSETFSENFSHTERCMPCTQCDGLLRMDTPCTDTNDATCVCDYGYFLSPITQQCQACTACLKGSGVLFRCKSERDTVCEPCLDDTFSDQESVFDPCLPCTTCEEQEELQHCTPFVDTTCQDVNLQNFSGSPLPSLEPTPFMMDFTDYTSDIPLNSTDSLLTTGPKSTKQDINWADLIPIYASVIPAVLLGIVAFALFIWWKSCKHNKQDGCNRSGTTNPSQTPSPEGEKLHSDSGISVDSQSLQEGQGLSHTVVKIDGGLNLPMHACEELEKLLENEGPLEGDWSSLAGLLGYEEERIVSFGQEERPIQALLSDWASRDSASVDVLCAALKKINREDLAQSIMPKSTATSAV